MWKVSEISNFQGSLAAFSVPTTGLPAEPSSPNKASCLVVEKSLPFLGPKTTFENVCPQQLLTKKFSRFAFDLHFPLVPCFWHTEFSSWLKTDRCLDSSCYNHFWTCCMHLGPGTDMQVELGNSRIGWVSSNTPQICRKTAYQTHACACHQRK